MKHATIIVIQPDGSKLVSQHDPKHPPDYKILQGMVGGLIQPCDQFLDDGRQAYCNEESLLHGMPPNPEGSRLVHWPVGKEDLLMGGPVGPLHGPVVILEGFEDEDEGEGDDEAPGPTADDGETSDPQPAIVGGALDVLMILHHVTKGTYHPAYFVEAPPPGPVQPVDSVEVVRLRSRMHHSTGAPTLEEAQVLFDELAQKIFVPPQNRWRDRVHAWDGTTGITVVVSNWHRTAS